MLVDDEKVHDALANSIREYFACMGDTFYFHIHAIYEPDDEGVHAGKYHAAIDLYEEGLTFHAWFVVNDDGSVTGDAFERWYDYIPYNLTLVTVTYDMDNKLFYFTKMVDLEQL